MGFYERHVFPWINDRLASSAAFVELRRETLACAAGNVIEIGFGSGLNLSNYPPAVRSVTAVEPNDGMLHRAVERVKGFGRPVRIVVGWAETLPFPDETFDTAVSTLTLCSVQDPVAVLRGLRRVLRPGARLLLLEHGRAADAHVAVWQDRLNGLQHVVACGCNLNRPVVELVEAGGFRFERVRAFYLDRAPKVLGWMTLGAAICDPPN
jgi:ubiquinone/menaquinone biosynthesis C-methylase UbiE